MGKFMLNFTKEDSGPFSKAQPEAKINFVTKQDAEADSSGVFQKTLCYASYYVMTFSAFCAFMPGHVAHAANMIGSVIPL